MRIFVYEYTCASQSWPSLPASLRQEGQAMLTGVLEDFHRIGGVHTMTLIAEDCDADPLGECHVTGTGEEGCFDRLVRRADCTLVIAPEFDELLTTRCQWVRNAGGTALNCGQEALNLTADKLALAEHWQRNGIPTLPTTALEHVTSPQFPMVCKPRFGAGSRHTCLVQDTHQFSAFLQTLPNNVICQPYHAGLPASVAFLTGPRQVVPLLPTEQVLSSDGEFQYLGAKLPLPPELAQRARHLATQALEKIPGLNGYVGVDLLLGDAGDVVVEINPRLTTSYLALRQVADFNLAYVLLQAARGESVTTRWRAGSVYFRCGEQ